MRKLLFTFACLCVLVSLARAQDPTYPTTYSRGGNLTTSSANCDPTACLGIGLPTPSAAVITVGLTGTWSGTLAVEESQDGGRTFTSAGASLTSTGTSSYVIAGFTSFRVRAGTLSSGNVGVNFTVSNAPSGGVTSGTGAPSGSCTANQIYVNQSNGNLYTCSAGSWVLSGGGGSGTVTNIATTGPITGGPITTTGTIACPTCTTSAAAITNNVLAKGSGGAQGLANSLATDDGTALTYTGTGGVSAPKLTCGVLNTTSCVISGFGSTSGSATITWPAVAGTVSNNFVFSNGISMAAGGNFSFNGRSSVSSSLDGTLQLANNAFTGFSRLNFFSDTAASPAICKNGAALQIGLGGAQCTTLTNLQIGSLSLTTNILIASTAPTIAAGGCGGSAASISANNGPASFNINVGTGPTSAGCTVTLPTAATGWNCFVNDFTTISTAVSMQKQTASGTASATFQNYSDLTVATAPTANDIYHVSCFAY